MDTEALKMDWVPTRLKPQRDTLWYALALVTTSLQTHPNEPHNYPKVNYTNYGTGSFPNRAGTLISYGDGRIIQVARPYGGSSGHFVYGAAIGAVSGAVSGVYAGAIHEPLSMESTTLKNLNIENSGLESEEQVIFGFAKALVEQSKNLENHYQRIIEKRFWDMI